MANGRRRENCFFFTLLYSTLLAHILSDYSELEGGSRIARGHMSHEQNNKFYIQNADHRYFELFFYL